MVKRVKTVYLEMTTKSDFRTSGRQDPSLSVVRVEIPCPELNQFLYCAVGAGWTWHARRSWDYAKWLSYLSREGVQTWVGYVRGTPIGYFELERVGVDVEIAYFGLLPTFIGRGLGGPLLSVTVERAWEMGAQRVWVHTCDLDHPAALDNYCARGFRVYRSEEKDEHLPDSRLESWPGANWPVNDHLAVVADLTPHKV